MTKTRKNEGFLYIETEKTKTFEKGEIYDTDNNLVCPGEIIHAFIDPDEPAATIAANYKPCFKTPILHGLRVRFYWLYCNNAWQLYMSTIDEIYPQQFQNIIPSHLLAQIKTEHLSKDHVYYAVIESPPPDTSDTSNTSNTSITEN